MFTREDGSQLHPDYVSDTFHRITTEAGLPPIRLHDLRHTAASLALQAGVPMKVVSEQLGHSSLGITADTYTSVLPAVAQAAAEAVAGIVPRRDPQGGVVALNSPGTNGEALPLAVGLHPDSKEVPEVPQKRLEEEKPQVGEGGPRGARTHNQRIKSPLLCRLS